jgi:predicted transposase YdaD
MTHFDASIKHVIVTHPADWAKFIGIPMGAKIEVVDSDCSAVSYAADIVLKVLTPAPYILHLEPQTYYDKDFDLRVLTYNVLLRRRHGLPVHSTAILLHPKAIGSSGIGRFHDSSPHGSCAIDFQYDVVRIWEQSVDSILTAGVGVLPLAPIADVEANAIPALMDRMSARFNDEAPRPEAAELWTATMLLLGVKYGRSFAHDLLKRYHHIMIESTTYQAIIEEGEKRGVSKGRELGLKEGLKEGLKMGQLRSARKILFSQGEKQFGKPDSATRNRIEKIASLKRLDALLLRILDAKDWDDLLSAK